MLHLVLIATAPGHGTDLSNHNEQDQLGGALSLFHFRRHSSFQKEGEAHKDRKHQGAD